MSGNTVTDLKREPELLRDIPAEVLEVVGGPAVARIESSFRAQQERLEYMKTANPLEKLGQGSQLQEALAEETVALGVVKEMAVHGGQEKEIVDICRQQAEMLTEFIDNFHSVLSMYAEQTKVDIAQIASEIQRMDAKIVNWDELTTGDLENVRVRLEEIAQTLPNEATLDDILELVFIREIFQRHDARAVASLKLPDLAAEKKQLLESKFPTRKTKSRIRAIDGILTETGLSEPEVVAAYPSLDERAADKRKQQQYKSLFTGLRANALFVGRFFEEVTLRSSNYYTDELMQAMAEAHDTNSALVKEEIGKIEEGEYEPGQTEEDIADEIEKLLRRAVVVEQYVSHKAKIADSTLQRAARDSILKPTNEASDVIKKIKDNDIERALHELEERRKKAKSEPQEYQVIEIPQKRFYELCTQARNMINGGHKLDHPEAEALSRSLQEINLGKTHEPKRLEPHQKGLLVGIATGTIDRVLNTLETFRHGVQFGDPMIRSLWEDKPQVHLSLKGFKPEEAILELQSLLRDEKFLNAVGPILGKQVDSVRQKVDELVKHIERRRANEAALARLAI